MLDSVDTCRFIKVLAAFPIRGSGLSSLTKSGSKNNNMYININTVYMYIYIYYDAGLEVF
jgi:hypothetical protein